MDIDLSSFTWQWVIDNRKWLFSGVGISILGSLFYFFKRTSDLKQVQESEGQSRSYQAGRDITVTGVSVSDVKEISLWVFKDNFPKLSP